MALRKARSAVTRAKRFIVSQRFGFSPVAIYERSFYEGGGFENTERSAHAIASWMVEHLAPSSVLDLGSGPGYYLRALSALGIETLGVEASPSGVSATGSGVLALTYDLRQPLHLSRRFDVVMSVEVAEHLPKRSGATLVASVCRNASNFAIFTAAPPGTPGTDHINCQDAAYWVALFSRHGFELRDDLSRSLRAHSTAARAAPWWQSWAWCFERSRTESS